ncbi:MAG: TVP38/TMEM64 family protein [Legionellaceae bacterium]|nr:TVP38/TMEM64 family protein [Legionellaceae bacterium]
MNFIKRWGLLSFLLLLLGLFFYSGLHHYLSFQQLKLHRVELLSWTQTNLLLALLLFACIYMLAVAVSIPGAWFLTLTSGFLFGPMLGTTIVILSATLGAFFVYLAVRFALRDWISEKTTKWLKAMEKGFQNDAFSYLLFLRLVPLFPFWLINIIPALLGVSSRVFILATFLGIIPGSFIYVLVGHSMGHVFDTNQTPSLAIIKDPIVFLPLLGLGLLALVPIIYRQFKQK